MARRVRDTNLETRNGRRALKVRGKPYWRSLDKGLHLGYRKRGNGGSWIVRRFTEEKKYEENKLGLADDFQDADGIKTLTYSQAQEAARAWNAKAGRIEAGLEEVQNGPYTVADAMRDYLPHFIAKRGVKGLSVANAIINAHILPELGTIRLDRLSTNKIRAWQQNLASAPARLRTSKTAEKRNTRKMEENDDEAIRRRKATANRILSVLKAALKFAWEEGKAPSGDTAWRRVEPFQKVDKPKIRWLNEAESLRLVNACTHDLRNIVQGALLTGCRYGELSRLAAGDYNPAVGYVTVRFSKSGDPRDVYLNDEGKQFFDRAVIGKTTKDLIFTRADGSAWGKSHQSRPMAEACLAAKITPAISFHVLRHTYGSLLAMKGVPMKVIGAQLGHKDTRITERHYTTLAPNYIAETFRKNFPTLGLPDPDSVVSISSRQKKRAQGQK